MSAVPFDAHIQGRAAALRHRMNLRCMWLAVLFFLLALGMGSPSHGVQVRDRFDHLTTGFELEGQHRDLPCESCHANAVFKGTPRDCAACHGIGTTVRATAKPANHILSTDRCASCPTTI